MTVNISSTGNKPWNNTISGVSIDSSNSIVSVNASEWFYNGALVNNSVSTVYLVAEDTLNKGKISVWNLQFTKQFFCDI